MTLSADALRRRYDLSCPIARALDLVGERWTLLVLRELLPGPLRFSEIKASVAGINATILSRRLEQLTAEALVRPVEQGTTMAYGPTERALTLWPTLLALARFGLQGAGEGGLTAVAALTAFVATRPPQAAQRPIGFTLGATRLEWHPAAPALVQRKAGKLDLEVTLTPELLLALAAGEVSWSTVQDQVEVRGALSRWTALLG